MSKYFVGLREYKEEDKDDILLGYDNYQKKKLEYLNDMYSNISTLMINWNYYDVHVHNVEVELKKDLMFFSLDEIESIIANKFTLEYSSRIILETFIKQYFKWGLAKGYTNIDPMVNFDKDLVNKTSYKVLKNKIIDMNDFYKVYDRMKKLSSFSNAIPYLLGRYGIVGKNCEWMSYLKWEDIDEEKKEVRIYGIGTEIITTLKVDDFFVNEIKEWKRWLNNQDYDKETSKNETIFYDYGYVIGRSSARFSKNIGGEIEPQATIYNRCYHACNDIDIKRISFINLVKSLQLDMCLRIRAERKVSTWDLLNVMKITKGSDSANYISQFKKFYEDLTGDKIVRLGRYPENTVGNLLKLKTEDSNSKEVFNKICNRLDYRVELD